MIAESTEKGKGSGMKRERKEEEDKEEEEEEERRERLKSEIECYYIVFIGCESALILRLYPDFCWTLVTPSVLNIVGKKLKLSPM